MEYMNRIGALPELPRFAVGGFVGDLPAPELPALGGGDVHVHMQNHYEVKDGKLTQASRQQVERDAARMAERGVRRSIASRK
jgi:hypothetical protein